MDLLSVPLQRPPQFDAASSNYLDATSDANTLGGSSSPALWGSDAISASPISIQGTNQSPTPAAFGPLGTTLGFGGIGSLVQQLIGLLQGLLQMLSGGGLSQTGSSNGSPTTPEEFFNQATGNSQGDPHLSFSGTDASNHLETSRFDSMTDHPNLLNSNSFSGGYQLSTKVGAPQANGATLNQSATITTDYGRSAVSLNADGTTSIMRCGKPMTIANGQTLDLGHGETVTKNDDGSLAVTNTNSQGGRMTTMLRCNAAGGVDVSADATGVNLGGDLVAEAELSNAYAPQNLRISREPLPQFWSGPALQ